MHSESQAGFVQCVGIRFYYMIRKKACCMGICATRDPEPEYRPKCVLCKAEVPVHQCMFWYGSVVHLACRPRTVEVPGPDRAPCRMCGKTMRVGLGGAYLPNYRICDECCNTMKCSHCDTMFYAMRFCTFCRLPACDTCVIKDNATCTAQPPPELDIPKLPSVLVDMVQEYVGRPPCKFKEHRSILW